MVLGLSAMDSMYEEMDRGRVRIAGGKVFPDNIGTVTKVGRSGNLVHRSVAEKLATTTIAELRALKPRR